MAWRSWLGGFLVALLFIGTIWFRLPDYREGVGERNLEASYHVLLTLNALDQTPAAQHHFLPIVSLGRPQDKHIAWGAAVPIGDGNYVYTSFFSLGFVLPYAALKLTGAAFSLHNLALFNGALGLAGALLFYILALATGRALQLEAGQRASAALLATTPMIFSAQALESTGLIYWPQNIYQLVLIGICLSLLRLLMRGPRARFAAAALLCLTFIGPFIEWTSLFANGAVVVVLGWRRIARSPRPKLAIAIIAVTALSLLLTFVQYTSVTGIWGKTGFLYALAARFHSRSVSAAAHRSLVIGYEQSFGLFLAIFAAALWPAWRRLAPPWSDRQTHAVACVGLVALAAMGENLALYEHAAEFAFDRYKFAVPLGLAIVVLWQGRAGVARGMVAVAIALSCVVGVMSYRLQLAGDSGWASRYRANLVLRDQIDHLVDRRCALFATTAPVRGYPGVWLMRGVHELPSAQDFAKIAANPGPCGAVLLHGQPFRSDIIGYDRALIITPDRRRIIVSS